MSELRHPFSTLTQEYVYQMDRAETLSGPKHAGQSFLRGRRTVPGSRGRQAIITIATRPLIGLTEVLEQGAATTLDGLAKAEQGIELLAFETLALDWRLRALDHLAQAHHIAQAVCQPGFSG